MHIHYAELQVYAMAITCSVKAVVSVERKWNLNETCIQLAYHYLSIGHIVLETLP